MILRLIVIINIIHPINFIPAMGCHRTEDYWSDPVDREAEVVVAYWCDLRDVDAASSSWGDVASSAGCPDHRPHPMGWGSSVRRAFVGIEGGCWESWEVGGVIGVDSLAIASCWEVNSHSCSYCCYHLKGKWTFVEKLSQLPEVKTFYIDFSGAKKLGIGKIHKFLLTSERKIYNWMSVELQFN